MITLKQNTTSTSVFTLGENTTITDPFYLFVFENTFTKNKFTFVLQPTTSNRRYEEFSFTLDDDNIGIAGWYWYEVYQQDNAENTDPSLSDGLVEEGKMMLYEGDEQQEVEDYFFISDNENNSNYVFVDIDIPSVLDTWGNTETLFGEAEETWG